MTTADTARDMDLIRQAVGDDLLTYYGISYGSYLGSTYAAMFPDRVRAIIVDGVLDPIAWSTGRLDFSDRLPFSTRLRSGFGAWDALVTAFNECDRVGRARCALSGQANEQWRRIVIRLKKGPFAVDGRFKIHYSDVVGGTLGALYSRGNYRRLMRNIKALYADMFGGPSPTLTKDNLVAVFRRLAERHENPYVAEATPTAAGRGAVISPSFDGVACADSVNPTDPRAWLSAGVLADRQGPWFGRLWTWVSSACARWPGSDADAFRGPWRVQTSSPVLIVGNFHDPATPISGARTLNSLFAGSRLLSLDTWGHGAIGQSACVKNRMSDYLLTGRLPVAGLVCQPNRQLFPQVR